MVQVPALADIRTARAALGDLIVETPAVHWKTEVTNHLFGAETDIFLKLELFQKTGTFKPRGALTVMMNLTKEQLKRGVTAVSAGNHAIAVAYAAKVLGTSAKIVMKKGANQFRIDKTRALGAEIVFAEDFHIAFEEADRLQRDEGRAFIHPFEGPYTFLGTATCGLEFAEQAPGLDAMIIGIGGGGLAAGFSAALKQIQPNVKIYGVEPAGADTMSRSFKSGKPETIPAIKTIADSLGAPMSMPLGVALCRRFIEQIVLIEDDEMIAAMKVLAGDMKLMVEPAAAAGVAALMGPLNKHLRGKKVGLLISGTNIAVEDFCRIVS